MKPIKSFHVSSSGDPHAGITPTSATVEFPIEFDDQEYVEFVREQLRTAFVAIMDDVRVLVVTDVEIGEPGGDGPWAG